LPDGVATRLRDAASVTQQLAVARSAHATLVKERDTVAAVLRLAEEEVSTLATTIIGGGRRWKRWSCAGHSTTSGHGMTA
jgi:hypothetical protein